MAQSPRTTLLLVEDDASTRESLAEVLRDAGYEVAAAADGQEALAYLADHALPTAILLDLIMPRLDGWVFRARQRENSRLQQIPVIVMTGLTPDARLKEHLGVAECLAKPVDPAALLAALRRHAG
jgi:two-component system, chemotaxis family, chemotaxis protein CheY